MPAPTTSLAAEAAAATRAVGSSTTPPAPQEPRLRPGWTARLSTAAALSSAARAREAARLMPAAAGVDHAQRMREARLKAQEDLQAAGEGGPQPAACPALRQMPAAPDASRASQAGLREQAHHRPDALLLPAAQAAVAAREEEEANQRSAEAEAARKVGAAATPAAATPSAATRAAATRCKQRCDEPPCAVARGGGVPASSLPPLSTVFFAGAYDTARPWCTTRARLQKEEEYWAARRAAVEAQQRHDSWVQQLQYQYIDRDRIEAERAVEWERMLRAEQDAEYEAVRRRAGSGGVLGVWSTPWAVHLCCLSAPAGGELAWLVMVTPSTTRRQMTTSQFSFASSCELARVELGASAPTMLACHASGLLPMGGTADPHTCPLAAGGAMQALEADRQRAQQQEQEQQQQQQQQQQDSHTVSASSTSPSPSAQQQQKQKQSPPAAPRATAPGAAAEHAQAAAGAEGVQEQEAALLALKAELQQRMQATAEPPAGPDAVAIRVRLPDGGQQQRRFECSDPLQRVYDWCQSLEGMPLWQPGSWVLTTAVPRRQWAEVAAPLRDVCAAAGGRQLALLVMQL